MLEVLETVLHTLVIAGVFLMEFVGVIYAVLVGIRAVIGLFRKEEKVGLLLGRGLALSLSFLMGGEILHTVIAKDLNTAIMLGATIVLRAALGFLIHWEGKSEQE